MMRAANRYASITALITAALLTPCAHAQSTKGDPPETTYVFERMWPTLQQPWYFDDVYGVVAGSIAPDEFEDDDTPEQASWIGVDGPAQDHNFDIVNDEDWMRFYTPGGEIITFETFNLGPSSDTFMEIIADDGETLIDFDDNGGANGASSLILSFPDAGFFYIRVTHAQGAVGAGTEYSIRVFREIGLLPGTLTGMVTSAAKGAAIPNATITLPFFGGVMTTTDANGLYSIDALPANTYNVEASAQGYETSSQNVVVPSDSVGVGNFVLGGLQGPAANFTASPLSGIAPLTVDFTDTSAAGDAAIASWLWDFGDSPKTTSTDRNPSFTYLDPGIYTVSLTVTTAAGDDIETKADYITVGMAEGPTANFTATPSSGAVPLTVQFTDTSASGTAPITAWQWDFGDSAKTTSTDQNPEFTYTQQGSHTVTLTVTTIDGQDTETKTNYITVTSNPTDVNGDGETNASDIQNVINAVLGVGGGSFNNDVNNDGLINASDIQATINATLGI